MIPACKVRLDELLEDRRDSFNWCSEDNDELIDLLLAERAEQQRTTQIEEVVTELLEDFKSEQRGGHEADYNHHFYRLSKLMEKQV